MVVNTTNPVKFGKGNGKLGKALTFSIPAIKTCPGRSKLCEGLCYATQGHYHGTVVKNALARAYALSKRKDFHLLATEALKKAPKGTIFRLHPSGDLYNIDYVHKWLYIMLNSPHVTFWVYTRSWRKPTLVKFIQKMSELTNVRVWYSCDKETGEPSAAVRTPSVRLAYMMVDDSDVPDYKVDLVFRDYAVRKTVMKHVKGAIVCPVENGVTKTQCDRCRICIRPGPAPRLPYVDDKKGRIGLALVS